MTKYRLRRPDGRLLGPFDKAQLFELKSKGHIKGNEEVQVFPAGNWVDLKKAEFLSELLNEDKTGILGERESVKDETFIIDITKIRNQKKEKEIEVYQKIEIPETEKLSETIIFEEKKTKQASIPSLKKDSSHADRILNQIKDELSAEFSIEEKTQINPDAQKELDRMRKTAAEEAARRLAEEIDKKRIEEEARKFEMILADPTTQNIQSDKTQVINLESSGILELAESSETEIEKEFERIQEEEKKQFDKVEDDSIDEDELKKNKKKKIIIIVAVIAILYAILFPGGEVKKKPFSHYEPQIVFPIPFDIADYEKSVADYNRGINSFNEGTYEGIIKAGLSFKTSYENNHESNYENIDRIQEPKKKAEEMVRFKRSLEALGLMVRSYGEQLRIGRAKMSDIQTLFNIIQSKRPYLLKDPNGVIGLNLFYITIQKPETAIDVVDKYLKLNPKNVTQDLFAFYVLSLLKQGRVDVAKQFFNALLRAPNKNGYAYTAILEYFELNQEFEKADKLVDEALKKYPKRINFLLKKAENLLNARNLKESIGYLKKAEVLGLDNNNYNLAKYLELKGLIMASMNKTSEATKLLTDSLSIRDSDTLRIKLASIATSEGKNEEIDKLIAKSKAIKYLLEGQAFLEKKNYNLALSSAAKATEAYPDFVSAELFLSKMQLRLGLAQEAIKTLEKLAVNHGSSKIVNLALIDAYIDTFKFNDAKKRIQTFSSSKYRESWEYASVNARLFYKMGDVLQAMSWLKTSIGMNPVNDTDIFLMAQILLKKANFEMARLYLNKCIEIDPMNPDYRLAYARLLFETQDDRAAIGYLISLKDSFGEDPKIMSEIAVFYYRSGKVKDFLDIKRQLEKEYSTDKNFYEFLIKSAIMDDRTDEVPGLVEKLLETEPGELEYMMTAGRVLFEKGQLVEAAKWFKRIKEKLPTYPKVLYYIAKIDFLSGDADEALKKIEENIKANGESDEDLVFKAQINLDKGKFIEAENMFKMAQKINPRSYDAIIGLADLSNKRSNHDLALDLYKSATKLRQDEPMVHKKIGDVYRQLGQGALAIEAYKMYLDMDPDSPHKGNLEAYINLMK